MQVKCYKGFYSFDIQSSFERLAFESRYKTELVETQYGLTFAVLANLPYYSFKGQLYANLIALENYAGSQVDVLSSNKMCYSLSLGKIVPTIAIVDIMTISVGTGFSLKGIPQCYALTRFGKLASFTGYLDVAFNSFSADKVMYENI